MQEWINNILNSGQLSFAVLVASFLFGIIGVVTSCCNVAVISAVVGYTGSLEKAQKSRSVIISSIFFLLGTVISLAIVGGLTGMASNAVGNAVGNYWKIVAGLASIIFGLAALNLLPFKMPSVKMTPGNSKKGFLSALVFGLAIGGISTSCNAFCNPVFPVILGAAFLKGSFLWGFAILITFAFGYALPLAATMIGIGIGLGKLSSTMTTFGRYFSYAAGVILIIVGFYFLYTF